MPRRKHLSKQTRTLPRDRSPDTSSSSSSSDKVSDICYPDVEVIERSVKGERDGDRGLEVAVIWAGQVIDRHTVEKIMGRTLTLNFVEGQDGPHSAGEGSEPGVGSRFNFVFRLPPRAKSAPKHPVIITCDFMFNLILTHTQDIDTDTYLGTKTDSMKKLFCGYHKQNEGDLTRKNEEIIFNYLEFRYLLETWKRFKAIGIPYPEIDLIPETLYLGFNIENKNGLFIKIVHLTSREHLNSINMASED